jgi:hypothetical protein
MWSAAVDPRVLSARVAAVAGGRARLFDMSSSDIVRLQGPQGDHLLIDCGGQAVRLDIIDGTTTTGPVSLHFDLVDDDRLDIQIATIRMFACPSTVPNRRARLADRLLALHALDAHGAGASLREIAEILLAPGEWPGDGEHRKSRVRRLLATGHALVRDGPRAILAIDGAK